MAWEHINNPQLAKRWTQERIDLAVKLCNEEQLSTSQIGARLGVSRMAVIGIFKRQRDSGVYVRGRAQMTGAQRGHRPRPPVSPEEQKRIDARKERLRLAAIRRRAEAEAERQRIREQAIIAREALMREMDAAAAALSEVPDLEAPGIPFFSRPFDACAAILTEDVRGLAPEEVLSCPEMRRPGSSYCAFHHRIFTVPSQPRRSMQMTREQKAELSRQLGIHVS